MSFIRFDGSPLCVIRLRPVSGVHTLLPPVRDSTATQHVNAAMQVNIFFAYKYMIANLYKNSE